MSGKIKILAAVLALGALFIGSRLLPLGEWMQQFSGWIKDHGALGAAIFIVAYVAGALLFLPASLFLLTAGVAFGLVEGVLIALVGAAIGSSASFFVARYVARKPVERMLEKHERLRAFNSALSEKGWKVVLLFRLTPFIPFPVSNYFWGITRIGFWPYLAASTLGILPGTTLFVYLGYFGKVALDKSKHVRSTQEYVFMGIGLVATIAMVIYLTRLGKKSLSQIEQNAAAAKAPTSKHQPPEKLQ